MKVSTTSEVGTGILDWARLLDDTARDAWLREAGVPVDRSAATYLRVKDGQSALLGLELIGTNDAGEAIALAGYVRAETPERAAELAAKWHEDRAVATVFGPGVRLLPGGASVLFLFPNDARIRGMRFVADVDKLKRMLAALPALGADDWRTRGRKSTIETVRYKPERRLIQRAMLAQKNDRTGAKRTREVFLRFFVDERGARIAAIRAALVGQPVDRHLPESLGAVDDGRMFVEAAVLGGPLLPELRRGAVHPAALARILADLHASSVDGLADWTIADVHAAALATIEVLGRAAPRLQPVLAELRSGLAAQLPVDGELVTSHGDAHLHQFLAGDDGPKLVDFERMVRAPRAFDLGHLRAHILLTAHREPEHRDTWLELADAVVREYAAGHAAVDHAALAFCTVCGLLERALLPYRRATDDWQGESAAILELAHTVLGAQPPTVPATTPLPCDVTYPRAKTPWAATRRGADGVEYGTFDPVTGRFEVVDPMVDPKLPGLRDYADRGELIGYRFGRRAMLRLVDAGDTPTFVKFVRPSRASALVAKHESVAAVAGVGFVVPTLLGSEPELGILRLAALEGDSLHARGAVDAEDLALVGRGLAAFHSVAAAAVDGLPDYKGHAPLREQAEHLSRFDPALHARCLAVIAELGSRIDAGAGARSLVHGDLHDKNIWVREAGLGLIDLDSVAVGDPAEDLGNLAAHLVLRAVQTDRGVAAGRSAAMGFLAAYEFAGGNVDRPLVTRVLRETLVRLACLYRFRRRWVHICEPLLDEAAYWHGRLI